MTTLTCEHCDHDHPVPWSPSSDGTPWECPCWTNSENCDCRGPNTAYGDAPAPSDTSETDEEDF